LSYGRRVCNYFFCLLKIHTRIKYKYFTRHGKNYF